MKYNLILKDLSSFMSYLGQNTIKLTDLVSRRNSNIGNKAVQLAGAKFKLAFQPYINNEHTFIDIIFDQDSATGAQAYLRVSKTTKQISFYYTNDKTSGGWDAQWQGTLT